MCCVLCTRPSGTTSMANVCVCVCVSVCLYHQCGKDVCVCVFTVFTVFMCVKKDGVYVSRRVRLLCDHF